MYLPQLREKQHSSKADDILAFDCFHRATKELSLMPSHSQHKKAQATSLPSNSVLEFRNLQDSEVRAASSGNNASLLLQGHKCQGHLAPSQHVTSAFHDATGIYVKQKCQ